MPFLLVRYVLTAAVRDRLLVSLFLVLIAGSSLAIFLGSAAFTEKNQFASVFAGSGLRIAGVLGLVLFVVFHVRRSFDAKDVEFLLSRPVSRAQFLFSFAIAFSFLAFLLALAEGFCVLVVSYGHPVDEGQVLWVLSMIVENIIMVNTAFFFAMILSSAASAAMATFGLYILGRMMGQILGIIYSGTSEGYLSLLAYPMRAVSIVTPRLDLLGQTTWLIYGADNTVGYAFILAQGVAFTGLLLIATMVDLARRRF